MLKTLLSQFYHLSLGSSKKQTIPQIKGLNLGDFARKRPFSLDFGFDRGGALDRYYIEKWLEAEAKNIQGHVLEIANNTYTHQFGKEQVLKADALHINEGAPDATIFGDLSNMPHVADNQFDCFIMTQTLQFIYAFEEALITTHRILKPGGTLLLTVPGITNIDYGEWGKYWYWSFTPHSIKILLTKLFGDEQVEIQTFGNALSANCFLYGVGINELSDAQKDISDERFPVIIAAKARKKDKTN